MSAVASPRLAHNVWFKFKSDATPDQIKHVFDSILGLKAKIPVILHVTAGKNITDRAKGFTHAIIVYVATAEDLPVYSNHPAHMEVVNDLIKPILEEIMAFDYVENSY